MEPASRTLSPKLHRLIHLASLGMTDKEIASEMEVSPNTVESHWKRLRVLFSTSSRTRIVADALQALLRDTQTELHQARNRAEELEQELSRLQSAAAPKSLDGKSGENAPILESILGTFPILAFRLESNGRDAQFMGSGVTRYGFMPHEFTSGMIQLSDLIHPEAVSYTHLRAHETRMVLATSRVRIAVANAKRSSAYPVPKAMPDGFSNGCARS